MINNLMISNLWIIIFMIALIIELLTPSALVTIWFAIGALIAYICQIFNFNFHIQVIIFITSSLATLLALRPFFINYLRTNIIPTNFDRAIGKQTILLKDITQNKLGEVKINGITWFVSSINNESIKKDSIVEVIAIEGSKLIVKNIGGNTDE